MGPRRANATTGRTPSQPGPSPFEPGIAARALLPLFAHLRAAGHDPIEFLRGGGVHFERLLDPRAVISRRALYDFWRRAEALTREPDLGLRVAGGLDLAAVMAFAREHIHLQAFAASATLGEGIARLARYFPLTYSESRLVCEDDGGDLRVRLVVLGLPEVPRPFAEFMLAWILSAARAATGGPLRPREVRFAHPRPASTAEHERVLAVLPTFAAGENALVFRGEDLATPLQSHATAPLAVYVRRGEEQLAGALGDVSFSGRVRDAIAANLGGGLLSSEHIATMLGVSVRTMARRLAVEGTAYGALLDLVRIDLARRHLVDAGRPSSEVAELLGFSEPGAFRRAFRRWFGVAPSAYVRAAAVATEPAPRRTRR